MSSYDEGQGDWYEESPNLSGVTTDDDKDPLNGIFPTAVPTNPTAENCSIPAPFFQSADYNIVTATICALYFMFGIFCAFFGYRCFKAIMFLTGFIFGSILVYLICLEENVLPMWANTLIAVCAGILFGLITLLVQYVGLFMLGFHGGLLLGIVGLSASDPWFTPSSPWVSVGILLVTGLTMSLCNLYFQKTLTIFNSAFYGGAVMATGLDFFVENSEMLKWVWDRVRVRESEDLCWFSWAILATWPLTLLLELYDKYATPLNISVIGLYIGELTFRPNVKHTVGHLYTSYNGLCKSFTFDEEFAPKSYVTFATPLNQTLIVYFLQPGDEILLIWHLWFDRIVPTVVIESDTMIELSRSTHTYLNKEDRQCKRYSHLDFMSCIADEIKSLPSFGTIDCIPESYAKLINSSVTEKRYCTASDNKSIIDMSVLIVEKLVFYTGQIQDGVSGNCVWPCTMKTFEVQHTRLGNAGPSENMTDKWITYVSYASDLEVISEEFYLYDVNAIISSVGGGLGMFLGVSCLGLISQILQIILLNKSWKRPSVK